MRLGSALQILLGTCSVEYFRDRVFEKRTAYFRSRQEVNEILLDVSSGLMHTYEKLDDVCLNDSEKRRKTVVSGDKTLVLNDIQDDYIALKSICTNIGKTLGVSCYVNAYITPRYSQGFLPHYDSHDVIILQLDGSKSWTVQNDSPQLVTKGSIQATFKSCAEASMQVELEKGSALYIPRGQIHAARTGSERSVHLTIGLYPVEISEVIAEMIEMSTYKSTVFRQRVDITDNSIESFEKMKERIDFVIRETNTYEAYMSALAAIRRRLDH